MSQDIKKITEQMYEMQKQMKKIQQSQKNIEVEGQSGAGLVKIIMTGRYDVKSVKLNPSLMSENKEILEDLVAAAVNDAVRRIEEKIGPTFPKLFQNFDLPTGFKFPF